MATSHSVWGNCPAHKRNQLAIPGGLVYPGVGIFQSYRLLVCGSGWGGLWTATLLPRLASLPCALDVLRMCVSVCVCVCMCVCAHACVCVCVRGGDMRGAVVLRR